MATHPVLKAHATLEDVQEYVAATNEFRGHGQSLQTGLLLLMEEVGELAKAARKQNGIHRDIAKANDDDSGEEAADVLWMLCSVCIALGVDLGTAFRYKEEKNKQRMWQ